jgi:alpha-L-rhamnosidase
MLNTTLRRLLNWLALTTIMTLSNSAPGQQATPQTPALPPAAADLATRTVVDPRIRQYITPARILWQSHDKEAVVEHPERLLEVGSGQIVIGDPACTLRNNGKAPAILLDFGRELHGGIQLGGVDNNPGPAPQHGKTVRVRVRFGESAGEAMSELGDKNSQTDHAIRDQIAYLPWLGTVEVGNTGFRFVRIDLIDPGTSIELKMARAVFLYRNLPYLGSFRCNDERLNKIWETGAYTVHLNMQDYLWDGIKRDRLVWIGDMHPETMTIGAVFGDVDVVRKSLDLVRDTTPLPHWMNGISSYSLWWVLIHHAEYLHYGDLDYLRKQQTYLTGLLNQLTAYIGPNNEETLPEGRFLDWPSNENKPAIHAGLHALLILTLQGGADLCATLGDPITQHRCLDAVARLKKHVPDPNHSKQAAALMALAGLEDAGKLNRDVMAVDGSKRLSTFYGYYVLQARAKAGDYQGCLEAIRQYWGGMLDAGATTFWEDFDLDWLQNAGRIDELPPPGKKDIHGDYGGYCYVGYRHSLCHGWASGPTPWLTEHVLGIQILEPGCKAIRIEPHLADLQWAEGAFPTPQGVLKVRHEKQADGSIKTTVEAPTGIRIVQANKVVASSSP